MGTLIKINRFSKNCFVVVQVEVEEKRKKMKQIEDFDFVFKITKIISNKLIISLLLKLYDLAFSFFEKVLYVLMHPLIKFWGILLFLLPLTSFKILTIGNQFLK
jgi:hypothetical protein